MNYKKFITTNKISMIFKQSISRMLFMALTASVLTISCSKEAKKSEPTDAEKKQSESAIAASTTAYSVINSAFNAIFVTGTADTESGRSTADRKYGCATVTATPGGLVGFPKDILIDFGTGCTLRGYTGKGSISFTLNQWISITGTEITPVFNNFYVNGYKIEGDYKITTVSPTKLKVDLIDGIVTFPDGTVFHQKGTLYYDQTNGGDTPLIFGDDAYSITGDIASTSTSLGTVDGTISSPLIKEIACNNISAGKIDFKTLFTTAVLDFGNGTCDNQGTLTLGGISLPVTLPF